MALLIVSTLLGIVALVIIGGWCTAMLYRDLTAIMEKRHDNFLPAVPPDHD